MIPVAWLIGAGLVGLIGGAAIVYFWDDILEWLHDFLPKVSAMIRSIAKKIPMFEHVGMMLADFVDAVNAKIEHKLYHKMKDGQWLEETTRRTLPESELPPAVKRKLEQKRRKQLKEADITEEMELETGYSIS